MRVKAIDVFCHSCNEWMPRCKFELLHWNKAQLCIECEAVEKKKTAANIKKAHKAEYKENVKKASTMQTPDNAKVKRRRSIEDIKEQQAIDREFEL